MSIITNKQKRELLSSIFGEGIVSSNGKDVAVHCPVCKKSAKSKKKRKLSISIESGVYHCWVCESKGRSLLRFIRSNFPNYKNLEKVREYFGGLKEEKEEEIKPSLSLPDDFKMVSLSKSITSDYIKDYLAARGMNEEDFYKYKVGYSFKAGFENRVIFPSFDKELSLNFYLTRTCDDSVKYLKYKNCGASKKDIIFNEDTINWDNPLILVEGVFDAVKAGYNAVPILGSWIDKNYLLFRKIVAHKTPVVLGLDPDAKSKEIKIAKNLFEHGIEVKIIQNKNKDLGDMTSKEVKKLISNAKHFDNIERMRYLIGDIRSGSIY